MQGTFCATSCVVLCLALVLCVRCDHGSRETKPNAASKNAFLVAGVRCWTPSYPRRTLCSWRESKGFRAVNYSATYSEVRSPSVVKRCHLIPPENSSHSSTGQSWTCMLEDLKLLTDYLVNITSIHPRGFNSIYTTFMMEDIVKPDPPVGVQLSPQPAKTLMWFPPPTWSHLDVFPLKYNVRFQWHMRGKIQTSYKEAVEDTVLVLKGLAPKTYTVCVCAMELLDLGKCSDWSPPVTLRVP